MTNAQFSTTYEYSIEQKKTEIIWESGPVSPFNELIVSWNGERSKEKPLIIYISLHQDDWSSWIKYAEWGPLDQRTFQAEESFIQSFQDTISPKTGTCDQFRIKAIDGNLQSLTACASLLSNHTIEIPEQLPSVLLTNFPAQSQMAINHPRYMDLCSPTSLSSAINYLLKDRLIDPVSFANKIHDREFNIYGNWILNTAEASNICKGTYSCHVERMANFTTLHEKLINGLPVVVSVKGSLPGAPLPYANGHLLCVIGYDSKEEKVLCMDPAFPGNELTHTAYPIKEFLEAWGRRYNLAYVFN